jgi:hypothetical protein
MAVNAEKTFWAVKEVDYLGFRLTQQGVKAAVIKDVLCSFPDYSLPFELYTDASEYEMGAVLMQGTKTLAFWSRKLKPEQKNYGVGEKEMLSVVEALKEFRTMVRRFIPTTN